MQAGRAKRCKLVEQKLNKKYEMVEQKNARWPSKKMQDGRAKKCGKIQRGTGGNIQRKI
jgi:hypothetical protein